MQSLADKLAIARHIHFLTGQREFWPLFRRAQLMVRPTSRDTYGISVAEALHLGCPAVASDVCDRHPGTRLFASRDASDLLAKCSEALATCK